MYKSIQEIVSLYLKKGATIPDDCALYIIGYERIIELTMGNIRLYEYVLPHMEGIYMIDGGKYGFIYENVRKIHWLKLLGRNKWK
jgi:hypothetical protein